jgi:hypothetical protein
MAEVQKNFVAFGLRGKLTVLAKHIDIRFDVLTAIVMKSFIFWDTTPCSPFIVDRRSEEYVVPSSGSKNKPPPPKKNIYKLMALLATCLRPGFLLGLFFVPEDGGDMFLPNVG